MESQNHATDSKPEPDLEPKDGDSFSEYSVDITLKIMPLK
jgi:hypothetical protein